MHLLKKLMIGVAAIALTSTGASAVTTIHVVGSTAYRAAVTKAIIRTLGAGAKGGYVGTGTSSASGLFGASQAVFTSSDGSLVYETNWTGSLSGVVDLSVANALSFVTPANTLTAVTLGTDVNSTPSATGAVLASGTAVTESKPPEVAMSDSFFTSVAASVSTANVSPAIAGATTGQALAGKIIAAAPVDAGADGSTEQSDATVGIVPFEWVLGATTTKPSGLTNITQETAAALIQAPVALSFFDGNPTNTTDFVYLVGRNEDSGTRIGAFAEAQTGFGNTPEQFQLTFSGTQTTESAPFTSVSTGGKAATVTGAGLWPGGQTLNTESSINWDADGHSGYIAGGDVANALLAVNAPISGSAITEGAPLLGENTGKVYFVGYLAFNDAFKVTGVTGATQGTALTYNGVAPTIINIQKGEYSFWSFEHMYYLTTGSGVNKITSAEQTAANALAADIFTTDAPTDGNGLTYTNATIPAAGAAGILYDSTVRVTRTVEGGSESINY